MRRVVFGAVGALLLSPGVARAVDYVNDPLTQDSFAGRGSRGGTFSAAGWTVTAEPDAVWYEIPDALPSGRIEYTVTGLSLATSLTGVDHDIFTMYQAPSGQAEPIGYSPYFRNNDFKAFTRIFGTQETTRPGAMKLELAFCPRGDPWYHDAACTPACDESGIAYANGSPQDLGWDAGSAYRMAVEWGDGQISFFRDGALLGTVPYNGTYAPQPLRVRFGSPRHDGVYPGQAFMPIGITLRDIAITGTPGVMTPECNTAQGGGGAGGGGGGGGGGPPQDGYGALADVTAASWEAGVFPDLTDLNVEGTDAAVPASVVYLRFPTIDGVVESAILRVHSHDYPSAAGGSGVVCAVLDHTWSEDTLTWATRPPVETTCAGTSIHADVDSDLEWDVTALVASGAPVDLAIVSTDADGAHFMSKEAADPSLGPRLFVQSHSGVGGAGGAGGGATGGAPSSGGAGATGGANGGGGPTGGSGAGDSCDCREARPTESPGAAALLAATAALAFSRRRRPWKR
ncbi:MAG: DNRLRE domain-containing protein [Polyangiaceae bacterium]